MLETMPESVVQGTAPEVVIPALIEHLRSFGDQGEAKANWITDVYSVVLKDIRERCLADKVWINDLIDVCCKQLNALALTESRVRGYHFGEQGTGNWGWWRTTDAES